MSKHIAWSKSLSSTLLKWFLFLSLAPILVVSVLAYKNSSDSLYKAVSSELEHSAKSYVSFVDNWFYYRSVDISSWSSNKNSINFMHALNDDFKKSKIPLNKYIKSYSYIKNINPYEHDLIELTRQYDYIYDLFLFDTQGNLLYTVVKEDDLGTNFFSGKYKNTKFTSAIKQSLKDGKIHFSDFEFYEPSKGGVYGFFTDPIVNEKGDIEGIYAIQIKPNRLIKQFELINQEDNGISHYLIGQTDFHLRTSITDVQEILVREIKTHQTQLYKDEEQHKRYEEEHIETSPSYLGPNKNDVIGIHHHINILGVKWVLISEMDKSTALSSSNKLAFEIIVIVFAGIIIVTTLALFISRRITTPLSVLVEASHNIAQGKREAVWIEEENEIGVLADSFNDMVHELMEKEQVLEEQAIEGKKLLHDLREQKLALDHHSIVAITNIKGDITYANKKFEELSGYSYDELMGQNHRLLSTPEVRKDYWQDMYATITKGLIWRDEVQNRAKDGTLYWVDTTIIPFLNDEGKPESYISLRTDITLQKSHANELQLAKEEAESALIAKGEFLASMSHEIRTPMNGVIGMLGLLKGSELNETQNHQVSLAESSAQSLLTLINDILDFSKVEAGKLELENLEFNLRDALGEFTEAIGHRAQENNIEIVLDVLEVTQKNVICDPGRLRQIMSNLVGNAIKFTHNGEILIKAALKEDSSTQGRLCIDIIDSGIGIAEDKLDALFDSFTQVDASTTRKYGGTGLGLAIVKKLAEVMGGSVNVSSVVGKGSTFSFEIALGFPSNRQEIVPPTLVQNKRVIVIDNNALTRRVICEQLELWGMQSFQAENADHAMKLCTQEEDEGNKPPFNLALIDMNLSETDGLTLGKKIKEIQGCKDIKLVMMTSLASRGDVNIFKENGFSASFPKPATTKDYYHALKVLAENTPTEDDFIVENKLDDNEHQLTWPKETRILLVEDNMTNQIVANGILETFGLQADTANDGEEALHALRESLKTQRYNLVLMDCQMPVLDGYETTAAIRLGKAGEENSKISIVAMTANAMKGDKEKCIASGMDEYLAKPINPEALKEMLLKVLKKEDN